MRPRTLTPSSRWATPGAPLGTLCIRFCTCFLPGALAVLQRRCIPVPMQCIRALLRPPETCGAYTCVPGMPCSLACRPAFFLALRRVPAHLPGRCHCGAGRFLPVPGSRPPCRLRVLPSCRTSVPASSAGGALGLEKQGRDAQCCLAGMRGGRHAQHTAAHA